MLAVAPGDPEADEGAAKEACGRLRRAPMMSPARGILPVMRVGIIPKSSLYERWRAWLLSLFRDDLNAAQAFEIHRSSTIDTRPGVELCCLERHGGWIGNILLEAPPNLNNHGENPRFILRQHEGDVAVDGNFRLDELLVGGVYVAGIGKGQV